MIQVDNLVKSYGSFPAVRGISFSVKKGEIVGILGLNGAGKSSTIRTLCGYFSATSGSIRIGDHFIERGKVSIRAKEMIGYLPESAPLYKEMIVYSYLYFVWMLRKGGEIKGFKKRKELAKKRIAEVCNICNLNEVMHKNIEDLSKGYRQRVGFAATLIADPEILILDEPTSGLDPNQIREIRLLIKKIAKTKTILLCSHILPEVEATCDRVIIIQDGVIVADDTTASLKNAGTKGRIVVALRNVDFAHVSDVFRQELPSVQVESTSLENEKDAVGFLFSFSDNVDCRSEIFNCIKKNGWDLLAFYQKIETLDNIFRKLTLSK